MCFKYLSAFDKLCSSSDGIHVAILTLWLYKYWSHSTRFNISHSIISSHQQTEGIWEMLTKRLTGRLPVLPRRHCSLLYAEPDASRVCLNTHLIYIRFLLLSLLQFFFVLFCNLAEMEVRYFWQLGTLWRQHSGDSAEPLFARVYQHIGVPLSPVSFHRQTGKGDWHKKGEKRRWDFEHAVAEGGASCFIARYLCHFFFKQKLKPVLFQGTQMANFTKDTHQSLRADNDFCKE